MPRRAKPTDVGMEKSNFGHSTEFSSRDYRDIFMHLVKKYLILSRMVNISFVL